MKDDPKQTAISISLPPALLKQINDRAKELSIPRSRYMALVAQGDIAKGGELSIAPLAAEKTMLEDFLQLAIPALEEFIHNPHAEAVAPDDATDAEIWELFQAERQQIVDHKWNQSVAAGRDVGWTDAIHTWAEKHRPAWIAEYRKKHRSS